MTTRQESADAVLERVAEGAGKDPIKLRLTGQLYDYETRTYLGDCQPAIVIACNQAENVRLFRRVLKLFVETIEQVGFGRTEQALERERDRQVAVGGD